MADTPIFVTKPFLPPLDEFVASLEQIWDSRILTNGGPFHERLEKALVEHLAVSNISLFNNGATALQAGLHALELSGEVLTTPYSFVATAHSILWNGLEPVFVDIDPETFNLDPAKLEDAVTPRTCAVLPVHVYGTPCDVEAIQTIASKHRLKVIYDGAHAFGINVGGRALASYGDLTMLSFHATKVFNTFEGGAIACADPEMKMRLDKLKNFGFEDEVSVSSLGLNGKMNEVQAAMGLLQLRYVDSAVCKRKQIAQRYRSCLEGTRGISFVDKTAADNPNYSYYPITVGPEYSISRDALYRKLRDNGIYARRYFYPLISDFSPYRSMRSADPANLPIATSVAARILCLPIYPELSQEDQDRVIGVILDNH